ncbi:MAG: LysR family transcriptional regulator [Terriglobia bacterium]
MKQINWNSLYGFWLVAKHHSFTEAARALPFGSAQALQKRVRTLENSENLDLQLLRSRGAKGVELTESGRRILALVSPVFNDLHRLADELRGEDSGPLHISSTVFSSLHYLPDLISAFSPKFPDVSIHVSLGEEPYVIGMLESAQADFGICSPFILPSNCEVKACIPMRVEIVVPRGHHFSRGVAAWKDLLLEPLVLPERSSVVRRAFDVLMHEKNLSSRIRIQAEVTTPELSVEAVRAGLGVALLVAGPRLNYRGLSRTVPPPGLPALNLCLLCRRDRYLSKYMRGFAEVAANLFAAASQSLQQQMRGRRLC